MNDLADRPPPTKILLATDLSARCDRPLDRARRLTLAWQAALTVLVVRRGPESPVEVTDWLDGGMATGPFEQAARAELDAEFAGTGIAPALQVADGDVTDGILRAAAALGNASDATDAIVVIGASHGVRVGHLILGSTAGSLASELAHPLLVVRRRAREDYARILVANDFGAASRRALATALRLFPRHRITLFHVLEGAPALSPEAGAGAIHDVLERSARFLDGCGLPPADRERIAVSVGHGEVPEAIGRHVADAAIDLVVLGLHRPSAVARVFIGSKRDDLLRDLPCDTLLVRAESGDDG